jgi:uncharacterized phage-associated protein
MAKKIYRAIDIATWFVNRVDRDSGDDITHLKLQKLVYYAQSWHLANYHEPLFKEDILAWTHGPVIMTVWLKYKQHNWQSLPPEKIDTEIDCKSAKFLELVYQSYAHINAKTLEKMTHDEPPWREARGNLPLEAKCTTPINVETMRTYYRGLIETSNAR